MRNKPWQRRSEAPSPVFRQPRRFMTHTRAPRTRQTGRSGRGAHRVGGWKIRLQERRSPGWRWKDPSRGFLAPKRGAHRVGGGKIRLGDFLLPGEALTGLEAGRSVTGLEAERSVSAMIRLGWIRARGLLAAELQRLFQLSYGSLLFIPRRGAHRAGGGKIRLGDFLLPGEALTGLEVERSVSGISCSQERRSPGWRRKDPSRGFLAPRRGAHRVGGGKIRLGDFLLQQRRSPVGGGKIRLGDFFPSWGFLAPRRAHRVGGWKIRLGDLLLPEKKALAGLEVERSVSRRGAHRAGGGKIRLGDDPSRTMIYSYSQERRSPGWRRKDPSP